MRKAFFERIAVASIVSAPPQQSAVVETRPSVDYDDDDPSVDYDDDDDDDDDDGCPHPTFLSEEEDDEVLATAWETGKDDEGNELCSPHSQSSLITSHRIVCVVHAVRTASGRDAFVGGGGGERGGGGRKSEAYIKNNAMQCDAMDSMWTANCSCSSSTHPGRCLDNVTIRQIVKERTYVYGPREEAPPSTKQRGDKLSEILKERSNLPQIVLDKPTVDVGELLVTLLDTALKVCENVFLMIIALANSPSQQKSKKWQACKKAIASTFGKKRCFLMTKEDRATKPTRHKPKHDHALQWLVQVGVNSSDLSVNADEENLKIVPYSSLGEMYREYLYSNKKVGMCVHVCVCACVRVRVCACVRMRVCACVRVRVTIATLLNIMNTANEYCKYTHTHMHTCTHTRTRQAHYDVVASLKCFRGMWTVQDDYCLYHSKGAFATCSICNITNKYLSAESGFHFGEFDRNILRAYRREHLREQESARQQVENTKKRCLEEDENGQPKECLFFWDAMSNWSTQSPHYTLLGGRTNKSDTGVFADRVMGCEIYCLDIDIIIFYHSDELVKGGANYMIEVVHYTLFHATTMHAPTTTLVIYRCSA
jgi:hypothetical protein